MNYNSSVAELRCPIPAMPATTPQFGYNEYGDMDYYTCEPGYSFQDDEVTKLFKCTRDATWVPDDQECISKFCPERPVYLNG